MPDINFINMFNFSRLAYNYGCVICVALNFHRAYIFGDLSSDSLVCLDHVDQGDGTPHKQDHVALTLLKIHLLFKGTIWAPTNM